MKHIIFIGGGFSKFYHLINEIMLEYFHDSIIYSDDINVRKVFKRNTILITGRKFNFIKILFYLVFFIPFLILFIPLIFFYNKKFFSTKSWLITQILHAYWDISLVTMKDDQISPKILTRFNALRTVFVAIYQALYMKCLGVNKLILGHSVYHSRVLLAFYRFFGNDVYNFANWNYHLQFKNYDNAWWYIEDINTFKINDKEVELYFKNKILGKGNSAEDIDKIYKSNKSNFDKTKKLTVKLPNNVIFLHIFKDSPFNVIDTERIFKDYFDWIEKSLYIISETNEKWSLRIHPSSERWGENQVLILNKILEKVEKRLDKNLNNITIENSNDRTSFSLLKNANKIVSFNGTIHLEALCFGIKPIIISKCMMSEIENDLVYKPKSFDDYKDLLISKRINFRLSENQTKLCKKYLYVRENYLSFNSVLKALYLYRGDSSEKFDLAFEILKEKIKMNKDLIKFNSKKLFSKSITNTSNFK